MTQSDRDLHILMKLANPDGFSVGNSYWYDNMFFKSEGWLEDKDQLVFSGEEFHNKLRFFALHSVLHGHEAFDFRGSDDSTYRDNPYVLIITGDRTLLCMFLRFKTYCELLNWVKNPVINDSHPGYIVY